MSYNNYMKTATVKINGKRIKLTPDVEANEEVLEQESIERIKAFKKKNPNADLSIYSAKVKESKSE